MKKKTKTSLVGAHLHRYGSITSWKAIEAYGATRLSAIIHVLRHERNLNIVTHKIKFKDKFGNEEIVAKYQLIKK